MMREIPHTASVGLCGSAGHAEVADEGFPHRHLLTVLRKTQGPSDGVQTCGIAGVHPMEHGAAPLRKPGRSRKSRITLILRQMKVAAEAVPLEGGVVGVFDAILIEHPTEHFLRQVCVWLRHIYDLNGGTVQTVSEQQDLKYRTLRVFVEARFTDVHIAEGLDINEEMMKHCLLYTSPSPRD